jgi:hypothetical protein
MGGKKLASLSVISVAQCEILICLCRIIDAVCPQSSYQAQLPIDRLPMAEETAAGTIVRKGCCPDDAPCAFLHRKCRIRTAHVSAYPARTNRVDLDAGAEKLVGKDPGHRIERRLGEPIAGTAAVHLAELPHPGGDVHDAPISFHQRDQCLAHLERSQRVGLQSPPNGVEIGLEDAGRLTPLPGAGSGKIPALFTKQSMRPSSSRSPSRSLCTDAVSVTSSARKRVMSNGPVFPGSAAGETMH